jgi:hypothetical protein
MDKKGLSQFFSYTLNTEEAQGRISKGINSNPESNSVEPQFNLDFTNYLNSSLYKHSIFISKFGKDFSRVFTLNLLTDKKKTTNSTIIYDTNKKVSPERPSQLKYADELISNLQNNFFS